MDYFALYNLAPGFKVDITILKKKYYQLSKQYHPDHYTSDAGKTEEECLTLSSAVNEGYAILQDKYALIAYILQQKGIMTEGEKYKLPGDFLMEMMDFNESLENTGIEEIEAVSQKIRTPVAQYLDREDISDLTDKDFLQVKEYYFKEKYLRRLRERIQGVTDFE